MLMPNAKRMPASQPNASKALSVKGPITMNILSAKITPVSEDAALDSTLVAKTRWKQVSRKHINIKPKEEDSSWTELALFASTGDLEEEIEARPGGQFQLELLHLLFHHRTQMVMFGLLLLDVILTIAEVFMDTYLLTHKTDYIQGFCGYAEFDELAVCNGTNSMDPKAMDRSYSDIESITTAEHLVEYTSITILFVFLFELLTLFFLMRGRFLKHYLYVLDLVVVALSIAVALLGHQRNSRGDCTLNLIKHTAKRNPGDAHRLLSGGVELCEKETEDGALGSLMHGAEFLLLMRLWRFIRVLHGSFVNAQEATLEKIDHQLEHWSHELEDLAQENYDKIRAEVNQVRKKYENGDRGNDFDKILNALNDYHTHHHEFVGKIRGLVQTKLEKVMHSSKEKSGTGHGH